MYDAHEVTRIVQLANAAQEQKKLADHAQSRARRATSAATKAIRQHRAARRDLAALQLNPHSHGTINNFTRREIEYRTTVVLSAVVETQLVTISGIEKAKAYGTAMATMKATASLAKERKAELNLYSTNIIALADVPRRQDYADSDFDYPPRGDPPILIRSSTLTGVARNWVNLANGTTTNTTHPSGRHQLPGFRPRSQEEDDLSSFRRQREFRTSADEQSSSSDDDDIILSY
jgi:hypothetical protein